MNEVIKQLNDVTTDNVYKTHALLDRVLSIEYALFPGHDITFKGDRAAFISEVGEYTIVVQRDCNTFAVISTVLKNETVVAECIINISGSFSEKYDRLGSEMKRTVSEWFTTIGEIDLPALWNSAIAEQGEPAEEAIPLEGIPAEVEAEETIPEEVATESEIVSEGESQ